MKKYLLAAVAAAVLASPAAARDGVPYVGIEGGLMKVKDSDVDRRGYTPAFTGYSDFIDIDHKLGYDVDVIGGYDFGLFRLEAELGYKRANHDEYQVEPNAGGPLPGGFVRGATYQADGRTSITTGMINALVDIGDEQGLSFYAGGGVGLARVSMTIDRIGNNAYHLKDRDLAYQFIGGVRQALTPNLDVGLKYRYFSAGTLKGDLYAQPFDARSFVHSHSLLASLVYNFAPPPPPPPPVYVAPPAPVAPATQTCPDGSVILATDACPAPPVYVAPPEPAPMPERG